MKLRPLQWVGLATIIVFGGVLAMTLMRQPQTTYIIEQVDSKEEPPPPAVVAPTPVAPPAEPLLVGSQDARDDLYCSGLIYAVHKANAHDSISAAADKRRANVIALSQAGAAKLKTEGAATDATTGFIADAHLARASKDLDTGSLRIPYETCVARADALPKAPQ